MNLFRNYILPFLLVFFNIILSLKTRADEGMFPLSSIPNINLSKAGLKLSAQELYNPGGISLTDAIVRLGGCTGSFVSSEGLIITNHHCAFGSVAAISDTINNYINNGFLAKTREEEVPAKGLTVKITIGYDDVSSLILDELKDVTDPGARTHMIQIKMEELIQEYKKNNPSLQYEISEMFTGKQYVLFKYRVFKDVRLVYVPQRNIGEYGGEKDNWEWPRHSGDFSFVRLYCAPDGSSAEFNKSNIPFKPSRYLKINPKGVKENDFVFILGYPGRTYRNQPAEFFRYHQDYLLPFITEIYDWKISKMEDLGTNNADLKLKYSSQIKSLANTTKNFKGKLQGFRRTHILNNKLNEENSLQQFIESDPNRMAEYGSLLHEIKVLYEERMKYMREYLALSQLINSPGIFRAAHIINNFNKEMKVTYDLKWTDIFISTAKLLKWQLGEGYGMFNPDFDKAFIPYIINYGKKHQLLFATSDLYKINQITDLNVYFSKLIRESKLSNPHYIFDLLERHPEKILKIHDPFMDLVKRLAKRYNDLESLRLRSEDELGILMARLLDIKMMMQKTAFIPDANATLRFTYGYVKGYTPDDGIYNAPFTTLKGIIEKADNTDYILPVNYSLFEKNQDFEGYIMPELNDLPVNFLYNLDTTGGNSGSPVLNQLGELVGVNFDRAYTATINDYAWNENYSRSVAVDIRYVLWVTKKVAGAGHLLTEMGI